MTESQSALDAHMEILGRTVAKFVSNGLTAINLDARTGSKLLGTEVDPLVFSHILQWMLDEGIIRARNASSRVRVSDGILFLAGVQLTAKGIAIVKQPSQEGSIEKKIAAAKTDPSLYQKIGDLIGSALGSFAKSLGGGG